MNSLLYANYLKICKDSDGSTTYVEAQEHCDIWWESNINGVAGDYVIDPKTETIEFKDRKTHSLMLTGKILAYSVDYGKSWRKLNEC